MDGAVFWLADCRFCLADLDRKPLSRGAESAAQGCECVTRYSVCGEVAASDLVFIGTVESVEPAFLDPWDEDRNAKLHYDEITRLLAEGSAAAVEIVRHRLEA